MQIRGWALLCAALAFSTASEAAIYKVGAGRSCTHRTIQAAVDAAAANPGLDYVRITREQSYVAQEVRIYSQEIQLEGGWASCTATASDATRTVVSGAGGAARAVFSISGDTTAQTRVTLAALDVTGGEQGGITFQWVREGSLTLLGVRVANNNAAGFGGGIYFSGIEGRNISTAQLFVGNDTSIQYNTAGLGGGGIYCRNAMVRLTGARASVAFNSAGTDGGGVHASGCSVELGSGAAYPWIGVLGYNSAAGNGGGLEATDHSYVYMRTVDSTAPTLVNGNVAGGLGGGIDIRRGAAVDTDSVIIDGNTARQGGGGVAVVDRGEATRFALWLWGRVRCEASLECARISNNIARSASGANQHGAAALYSTQDANDGLSSALDFREAMLVGNQGATLVRAESLRGPAPRAYFEDSVVRNNSVAGDLFQLVTYLPVAKPDTGLTLSGSTLAENKIGGAVFRTAPELEVQSSIVWQPGTPVFSFIGAAPAPGSIAHDLVSDTNGVASEPTLIVADPRFVAAGNLRLRADSPALDFTGSRAGFDRDSRVRSVDLPAVANRYGPVDLGAYERQTE